LAQAHTDSPAGRQAAADECAAAASRVLRPRSPPPPRRHCREKDPDRSHCRSRSRSDDRDYDRIDSESAAPRLDEDTQTCTQTPLKREPEKDFYLEIYMPLL